MADRARLLRLQRLSRVRAIARQEAVREAAEAESTLAQLRNLADRTAALAQAYDQPTAQPDAARLSSALGFRSGLIAIRTQALADQARAQTTADSLQGALAQAERRRALVQDRVDALAKVIASAGSHAPAGASRRTGTELDTE